MLRCEILFVEGTGPHPKPDIEPGLGPWPVRADHVICRQRGNMARAILTINSRNYGSWSLRGWLRCKMAGLDFDVDVVASDDAASRAELLLLSPSFPVTRLDHDGIKIWDTLAIAEYLAEIKPDGDLLPADRAARAHCRSISGEMHSGFNNLRSALPMNLKARYPGFKVWGGAQADIDRIVAIWHGCLDPRKGPYLFGKRPCMADAMYAPVVTRFLTYHVRMDDTCIEYCQGIMALPAMGEWIAAAQDEPEELEELDVEF